MRRAEGTRLSILSSQHPFDHPLYRQCVPSRRQGVFFPAQPFLDVVQLSLQSGRAGVGIWRQGIPPFFSIRGGEEVEVAQSVALFGAPDCYLLAVRPDTPTGAENINGDATAVESGMDINFT